METGNRAELGIICFTYSVSTNSTCSTVHVHWSVGLQCNVVVEQKYVPCCNEVACRITVQRKRMHLNMRMRMLFR